jgi:RNA polymerase sigma-70 factor (ECF subfamily)
MPFNEIYHTHYRELRRFGRQFNISPELTEDLIQETFLRFYLELKNKVVFDNPRAWLYKVLINLFKTHLAKEKRAMNNIASLKAGMNKPFDLHEEFVISEKQKIVFKMLEQLPERDKTLLLLYHSGLSYSEMAEAMAINPSSIGTMLVRAIAKLKNELKTRYHEMFE